ncbi:hypothetical protein F4Y93_12770 [Candidatus Poribacteria bacterium]|nr:hypothetical protein [Candidatus Poribacteria bacterium]
MTEPQPQDQPQDDGWWQSAAGECENVYAVMRGVEELVHKLFQPDPVNKLEAEALQEALDQLGTAINDNGPRIRQITDAWDQLDQLVQSKPQS